jgi:YD repeat-containing protein
MARAKNYTLGRGKLYADFYDADGNLTGEFYIGNTTSLTYTSDEDVLDHFDSDDGVREKDDSVQLTDTATIGFTTDDIQPENLAMFIKGEKQTLTVAPASNEDETITVLRGRHYQLGVSDANPTGLRALDNVTVTNGMTPVAASGNFEIDETLGRLYILEDAADIEDGDELTVEYDVLGSSRSVVLSTGDKTTAALRYIAANPKGPQRDHYWPKVIVSPDGDYELKGDDWQAMSFSGEALKVTGRAKHYIDGRPAVDDAS